jgi:hypothetical protein
MDIKELNDTLKSVSADLTRVSGELKEKAEAALAEAKTATGMSESTKEKVDELLTSFNEKTQAVEALTARIDEIEQKGIRAPGGGEAPKSLGELFVGDDQVKAWMGSRATSGNTSKRFEADLSRVRAELNSATTNADGSVGDAINQTDCPGCSRSPNAG